MFMPEEEAKQEGAEERMAYAATLHIGVKSGLYILVVIFLVYVSGVLTPIIPFSELPSYWGLPVHEYIEKTGSPSGWSWVGKIDKGDALNFFSVAWLSLITIVCYLRIIPILIKKRDTIYAVIAVLEVIILILAASGILRVGGH